MPDFVWRAATASGKVEEGRLTAAGAATVLKQLREQGLTPLSIDDARDAAMPRGASAANSALVQLKVRQAKGPVTSLDVLAITSELAIMLRAGLALDNALRVLIDMSHKPSVLWRSVTRSLSQAYYSFYFSYHNCPNKSYW